VRSARPRLHFMENLDPESLDQTSLGELPMHFMLETIIAAHLLGVDPFDQPAVEEGKILAKQYLNG
jgi:glucose-6-phosphate isomerase